VLTKSNGFISGSARSVPGFDVYKAIESCRDILENFGGHTYAAGADPPGGEPAGVSRAVQLLSFDKVESRMMSPQITVDAHLSFSDITQELVEGLSPL